jgi:hypothetical protein
MSTFYTYVIRDPRNMEPIYVGKGCNGRMHEHWNYMMNASARSNNPHLYRKLTAIFRAGYTAPIYERVLECEDEKSCFLMERFLIQTFGRKNLCNMTDGGEGKSNPSEESRKKFSESMREVRSREGYMEKWVKASKAAWSRPERREKNSESMKLACALPGAREKKIKASKIGKSKLGYKKRQSDASKAMWAACGHRDKVRASLKESWNKSGYREKMSAKSKEVNARPGMREQKSEACKAAFANQIVKERHSKSLKASWAKAETRVNRDIGNKAGKAKEGYSERQRQASILAQSKKTPEELSASANKTWATRRANAALKTT